MSHSCPNLVSTSFYTIPIFLFLICRNFLFTSIIITRYQNILTFKFVPYVILLDIVLNNFVSPYFQ